MNQHLKQAIAAARAGKKPQAKVLLARVIKDEPENVNAWFLLSSLADTEEQKIQHLEKVLELQPDHSAAAEQLAELVPPQPAEEALPDFDLPEAAFETGGVSDTNIYPPPEVDLPPADVPDDPDEAMAWLERLAADQGAPLDELPSMAPKMAESIDTAETTIEMPEMEYAEPEAASDEDYSYAALTDREASESDAPDDPDEAMAWLERLAAEQGAPLDELPSLFDSAAAAEPAAEAEDDFAWLEEMADDEDYLETTPTLLDTEGEEMPEEEELAKTLRVSNDYDFLSQSKGDSIPAWLAGEEDYLGDNTVIVGLEAEEEIEELSEPENLPDWLSESSAEGWVGDEGEKSGQVVWKAGQGDESLKPVAPGAKKEQETRKKSAARQTAGASSSNLYLAVLIFLALFLVIAIFYILITQPL